MTPLVLALQGEAADGTTALPDVLRKARMVASKLKLDQVSEWIGHELNGYPLAIAVPDYRVVYGDLRAMNPMNGHLMPVRVGDPEFQAVIERHEVRASVGNLYDLLNGDGPYLKVGLSAHEISTLRPVFDSRLWDRVEPFRKFSKTQLGAVLETVRNRILEWTLALESQGILGEGLSFTPDEKVRAASMTSVNIGSIGSVHGVVGSMTDSALHIDNVAALDKALESRGLSREERAEIQQLIAAHKAAPPEGRLATARRGIEWVVDRADKLGSLAALFRDAFGAP